LPWQPSCRRSCRSTTTPGEGSAKDSFILRL
jgi:hypothetical protein